MRREQREHEHERLGQRCLQQLDGGAHRGLVGCDQVVAVELADEERVPQPVAFRVALGVTGRERVERW